MISITRSWSKCFLARSTAATAYAAREKYSKLYGMWHTDIGPLNQVIHIWQYDSLQQRADIRAAAAKDPSGLWPPKGADLIVFSGGSSVGERTESPQKLPNRPWMRQVSQSPRKDREWMRQQRAEFSPALHMPPEQPFVVSPAT